MKMLKRKAKRARQRARRGAYLLWKRAYQRLNAAPAGHKETIFVGGMMRSGTNMVMDVLEVSPETDVFHERDPRAFDDYLMREPAVIHRLIERSNARKVVVKALLESHKIDWLLTEFAPARAVWVYRDIYDAVNSQIRQFSTAKEAVTRLATDPQWDNWRTEGMTENCRAFLKEHFTPELTEESCAAIFWYLRNQTYFDQGLDKREDVYLLRYEDCVRIPESTFARLFAWIGIGFRPDFSRRIFTSSLKKNERPAIEPAIAARCEEMMMRFDALAARQDSLNDRSVA